MTSLGWFLLGLGVGAAWMLVAIAVMFAAARWFALLRRDDSQVTR